MAYSGTLAVPGYSSRGRTIPEEKLGSLPAKRSPQCQEDVRTFLSMRLGEGLDPDAMDRQSQGGCHDVYPRNCFREAHAEALIKFHHRLFTDNNVRPDSS